MTDNATPGLTRIRLILWVLVALTAAGATVLFLLRPAAEPLAVTGRPFALHSTAGGTFTEKDLVGVPSLVFFGYTNCPDVCPTTLAETVRWKNELGIPDNRLRTIFITVDPARDTLETLKAYLGAFDEDVIGLVGDASQTEAVKAAFGATGELGDKREDGFYLVSHTASVYLIDGNGRFQGLIDYSEAANTALGKIKRLVDI
jgi:protein SCO1/2